jgi:hypothetical protein
MSFWESLGFQNANNLIVRQRDIIMRSFKQWVFPFAEVFLDDFPQLEVPQDITADFDLNSFADKAADQIKTVKQKLIEYKSTIMQHDRLICRGQFNNKYKSSKPFFAWENHQFSTEIEELLGGGKILLYSDILRSDFKKEAIKFNQVLLQLRTDNEANQRALDELLKSFKVVQTHLGNSYYKYDDRIYLISSNPQSIEYSFEKDDSNQPVTKNNVFTKTISGDLLLSPYAMWEISFVQVENFNSVSFQDLQVFRGKINLELIGEGSFVNLSENVDLHVDENYRDAVVRQLMKEN